MALRVLSASTHSEPVPTYDLLDHLHAPTDDETQVEAYATAAREWCETFTRRALKPNTQYRLTLDEWPNADHIEIPRSPLSNTTGLSVTYYPSTGGSQTFSSTGYIVDDQSEPGRVVLKRDVEWPTTTLRTANAVQVDFYAGSTGGAPDTAKHAIRMLTDHWYENRSSVLVGSVSKEIEFAVKSLLWSIKVPD